jgi:two-component system KDP operon response regulator KdpE
VAHSGAISYSEPNIPETKVQIGELRIDLKARQVFIGEEDLHLTRTEYAILAVLAQHMDAIVTHDELIVQV